MDKEQVISELREIAKNDPGIVEEFKKHKIPLSIIDNVHIDFVPLEVSAKTKDKKIYLNEKLLEGDPIADSARYIIHEMVHMCQQTSGKSIDKGDKTETDYLDLPSEEIAFQKQLDFIERSQGEEEADDYLEKLLTHHDLEGKERKEKKEELLEDD